MEYTMNKQVEIYLTLDIEELIELRNMLVLVHRDILSKLPSGATMQQTNLLGQIQDVLSEARL